MDWGPISERWRERGLEVELVSGPHQRPDADLALLHVDLTVIPDEYMDYVRRLPRVLNGGVADISKRRVSSHLLRRGDRHDGQVIVKTDRNDGGGRDWSFAKRGLLRPRASNYVVFLKETYRLARRWRRHGLARPLQSYRVFGSISEVPEAVWDDPELVVERFLSERRGDYYCVRTWLFLGDRDRHAIFFSHSPIVKSTNIVDFERLAEVPEELQRLRRELRFDFGKFDYAMVDGRVVLFDANRTPTIGAFPRERYLPIAQSLAAGLEAFF